MRLLLLLAVLLPLPAQDITAVISGGQRPAIALPDLKGSGAAQSYMAVFNETLAFDIAESGIFKTPPKSFYPKSQPAQPADVRPAEWRPAPVSAHYLAVGYGAIQAGQFVFRGWLVDLSVNQPVLGAIYPGPASEAGARKSAHEFAADIVRKFGGVPVLGTKIFFRSRRTGHEEIWVMDPDGSNQRPLTHLNGLLVSLGVAPDGANFSFTTGWPHSPGLAVFSFEPLRQLRFLNPEASLVTTPSFTPDGKQIVYSAALDRRYSIYIANADGSSRRRISESGAIEVEPKINPKSAAEIAFVSDRSGPHQIYTMNLDGGDVNRLTTGEGYASNPSWRPNGQHLAFAWTRGFAPGHFNIFVMDVAARRWVQLTHNEGRNENPSWAPDGVHLVFMSTRSGSPQIWTMRADGLRLRQLTTEGVNDTPVWSR